MSYSGATLRDEGPDIDSAWMSEYPLKSRENSKYGLLQGLPTLRCLSRLWR